ncbi:MAG: HEAT repeat domain-containing protein [Planctomycetota bacterium]
MTVPTTPPTAPESPAADVPDAPASPAPPAVPTATAAPNLAAVPPVPPVPPLPPVPRDPDDEPTLTPAQLAKKRRSLIVVWTVAIAMVVVPGIFWMMTWFGMRLNDTQTQEYLEAALVAPANNPDIGPITRRALHALDEVSTRLSEGDSSAKNFFPLVVKISHHREPAVRRMAAWVMGDAPRSEMFHAALIDLTHDPDVLVRQNAGVALSKFNDPEHARPVLLQMLEPYALTADHPGAVEQLVDTGTDLTEGMQVAVIHRAAAPADAKSAAGGAPGSLLAPLSGRVMETQVKVGETVTAGQTICLIQPNPNQVFNALTALALVGTPDDLPRLQKFTLAGNGDMIRGQAETAIQMIHARNQPPHH